MKPTNPLFATLVLAGTALAADNCSAKEDCSVVCPITDYSTLRRREVGARNTLVCVLRQWARWSQ